MSQSRPVSKRALTTAVVLCGAMILGCMERSVTGPAVVGATDAMTATAGNNQSGTVSNALSTPLTVQIKNSAGAVVANAAVSFVVASGGGTVSPAIVNTNATGTAMTTWTLGTTAGTQSVIATAGAQTVSFIANGISSTGTGTTTTTTATPAQLVLVSGAGQTGTIGQPLPLPVVVKVLDAVGNTVSGAALTWTVVTTSAGNGAGTSSSPVTSVTDVSGQASTTWILGAKIGQQAITATVGSLTYTVNATGQLNSTGAILVDNGNNQTAATSAVLPTKIRVLVVDQNGSPALGARVTWAILSGGGSLSKSNGTTNASGLDSATFTLGAAAGPQTATATVASAGTVQFAATAATIGGSASTLTIISGDGQVGQSAKMLPLPLVAEVKDASGNPLSGVTVKFTQAAGNSDAFTSPTSVTTGVDGRVSVTWQLATNTGTTVQTNSVTASIPASPAVPSVTFTASVRPAFRIRIPAANLVDTMQTDTTGATLRDTLFVQVYDPVTDKGVQGIRVSWATQASTTTDGFAVNSADTTDNTGLARNRWVLRSSSDGSAIPSGPVAKRMIATAAGVGQVEFKAHVYPGVMRTVNATLATVSPAAAGSGITWCATPKDANGNVIDSAVVTYTGSSGGTTVTATQISRLGSAICNTSTVTKAGTWFFGLTVLDSVRPYHKAPTGLVIQWPVTEAAGTLVVSPGAVSSLAIVSGNGQTATRGTTLPAPIRVLVTDVYGNPVPGTSVSFAVVAGAGLLSAGAAPAATATVTTGADGTAAVTWTLGAAAGTNTVTVAAGGAIVIFTATGN